MVFTDDLLALMPSTLTHAAWVGMSTDGYATTTYSTATTDYRCRIENDHKLVRNFDGEETLVSNTVWVASTSTFSALDQFTLPDSSTPPLLTVNTYRDENGVTHSKLGFGS